MADPPHPDDELLSIGEAARRAGVSAKTIRRRLVAGDLDGAFKRPGPKGDEWAIPASALGEPALPPLVEGSDQLRRELDEWRLRALAAESLADERAGSLDALHRAVEMLEEERARRVATEESPDGPVTAGVAPEASQVPQAPASREARTGGSSSQSATLWTEPAAVPDQAPVEEPVASATDDRLAASPGDGLGRLPWVPLVLASLAGALRLAGTTRAHDLSPSELAVARLAQGDGALFDLSWFSHPPLVPMLSALSALPLDAPDVVEVAHLTRVWGAAAAAVVAWAAWRLANRAGAGMVSFVAALLVVVDPAVLLGAGHSSPALIAVALLLTGHVLLLDDRRELTARRATGVGLLYGAAVLSTYSVVPLLAAVPLMTVAVGGRHLMGRIAAPLMGLAVLPPFVALMSGDIDEWMSLHWDVPRLPSAMELSGGAGQVGIGLLVAGGVLSIVWLASRRQGGLAPVTAHLVVTAISAGFLALAGWAVFDQVLFLTTAGAVAVPALVAELGRRRPLVARDAVLAGVAVGLLVGVVGAGAGELDRTRDRRDDVAVQLAAALAESGTGVWASESAETARLLGVRPAPGTVTAMVESGARRLVLSDRLLDGGGVGLDDPALENLRAAGQPDAVIAGRTDGAVVLLDVSWIDPTPGAVDEAPRVGPSEASPGSEPSVDESPVATTAPTSAPPTTSVPTTVPSTTAPPAATAPPVPVPSPPTADSVVVGEGEHFWAIAERRVTAAQPGATVAQITAYWADLIDANADRLPDPANPDLLFVGQQLVLPPLT